MSAKNTLQHPPVRLTGTQAVEVSKGFSEVVQTSGYEAVACSILPDHVHLLVRRHERDVKRIAGHFKSMATRQLRDAGWFVESPVWADGSWAVFLNSVEDVERAIRYVVDNPDREGLKRQNWSFVNSLSNTI